MTEQEGPFFCISRGEKLPSGARFCSACGREQMSTDPDAELSIATATAVGFVVAAAAAFLIVFAGASWALIAQQDELSFVGASIPWETWVLAFVYAIGAATALVALSTVVLTLHDARNHFEGNLVGWLGAGIALTAIVATVGSHT